MPRDIPEIGGGLFDGCTALADAEGYVIIDAVCYGYLGSSPMPDIPQGVQKIASGAFRDRKTFLHITLPVTAVAVGAGAFRDCLTLQTLRLPGTVTDLGETPFAGCDKLCMVVAPGIAPGGFLDEIDRIHAALGFCDAVGREGDAITQYPGEIATAYRSFVDAHTRALAKAAIDRDLLYAAAYFTNHVLIGAGDFPLILERAQQRKAMEIVTLLLDYKNKRLKEADVFEKYSLDDI
jgi:hypothetical protein